MMRSTRPLPDGGGGYETPPTPPTPTTSAPVVTTTMPSTSPQTLYDGNYSRDPPQGQPRQTTNFTGLNQDAVNNLKAMGYTVVVTKTYTVQAPSTTTLPAPNVAQPIDATPTTPPPSTIITDTPAPATPSAPQTVAGEISETTDPTPYFVVAAAIVFFILILLLAI